MRLTWLSNAPWVSTGYGQQTALFGKRLVNEGHAIGVISTFGHSGEVLNWNGMQVFGNSFHPFGMDILYGHSRTFQADALLTLLDLQVMELDGLRGTKWIAWYPCDHDTIPPVILEKLKHADARIAMSKHAQKEAEQSGLESYYIPCGVDTNIYKPLDRALSRNEMQMPLDKFIIGMVAMNKGNPSRKAFQQTIEAFAALNKKHSDTVLYLHTLDGIRGYETVDLLALCNALGLKVGYAFQPSAKDAQVIFADQYGLAGGYTNEMMAKLYNCMDVHSLVTMGEGFGVPLVEAQACGTPVITGSWTSMPELCFSGWKVDKKDATPIFTPLGAWHYLPRAGAIAEKMEAAYQMRGNPDYRKRATAGAQAYDADLIVKTKWLPILEKIAEKLKDKKPAGVVGRLRK